MYSRREKNRQLSACSSTSRSRPTFPIASGRITHIWRHVAGGDRLIQDDELGSGSSLHRCIARSFIRSFVRSLASRCILLVDDSRLRRYNCGLRSETRGNPRERRFLRLCAYPRVRACIRVSTLHRVCVCVCVCACAQRPVGIYTSVQRKSERGMEGWRATHKSDPSRMRSSLPPDKSLLLPCFSSYVAPGTPFYDATWKSLSFDREFRRSAGLHNRSESRGLNFFEGF